MTDETVPVPRALVEALTVAVTDLPPSIMQDHVSMIWNLWDAARALVDAVERPTAGGDEQPTADKAEDECAECGNTGGYHSLRCSHRAVIAPADPVSEARCQCGHQSRWHPNNEPCRWVAYKADYPAPGVPCGCELFTLAPPPATPREELADATPDCRCGHSFHGHLCCWNTECDCPEQRNEPTLAEAWDEGWVAGHSDAIIDITLPGRKQSESNPYRDPAPAPATTADLPTTQGSVIEATGPSGCSRPWFCRVRGDWINENGTIVTPENLRLDRVVFDAGERGEP